MPPNTSVIYTKTWLLTEADRKDLDFDTIQLRGGTPDARMEDLEPQDLTQETPAEDVFIPPSIDHAAIKRGSSYTYHTSTPSAIAQDMSTECVLGVDEAGRGPVLGMLGSPP